MHSRFRYPRRSHVAPVDMLVYWICSGFSMVTVFFFVIFIIALRKTLKRSSDSLA